MVKLAFSIECRPATSTTECACGTENDEWVGFVGIREKFGDYYLDMDSASAVPLERRERCPLEDLSEGRFVDDRWRENKPLFEWLLDRTSAYDAGWRARYDHRKAESDENEVDVWN
jgi:hypothetical protein